MESTTGTNRPPWDAEKDFPELCEKLRKFFREIKDPEIGLDIIQLGLVRNVKIEPKQVLVRMILTTPFCPYGPTMLEATRQKAEEALGISAVIDFGMEMWDYSMMEEGAGDTWGLF